MTNNQQNDGWKDFRLGDLFHVKHGFAFDGKFFTSEGAYVLLSPGNFFDEGGFKHKEQEKYFVGKFDPQYLLNRGDLIVAMTEQAEGLLGSSALIPCSDTYLHNQRLGLIVDQRQDYIDTLFLYYLFNTSQVRCQIRASASGTKVRHTSPSRIGEVKVRIPAVETQRKIAGVLSAYDNLIKNNTRRIAILDSMAQALYQEWFVRFRYPGHENGPLSTSLEESCPQGWSVRRLGEVCFLVMGQSPSSEFYNDRGEGLPFHQGVTNYGERYPTHQTFCTVANRVAERDDILFSVRAPVGRINIADSKLVVGRGLSAIRHRGGHQLFQFHQLREQFQEEDSMGGGTIFKSVTKDDMQKIEILVPPAEMVQRYEQAVSPSFLLYENLTKRNRLLRQTRDLLLPKLISGQIDVELLDIDTGAGLVEVNA